MSEEVRSREEQALRIHDLLMRLDEAEETLRAIRCGEVDALVIKAGGRQHIYTLRGADHAYRILFETLNEGALTIDDRSTILFANSQFARLVDRPLPQVLSTPLRQYIAPEDQPEFDALLSRGLERGSKREMRLQMPDGRYTPVMISMNAVVVEDVGPACTVVVTDLTDLKDAQRALEQAHAELAQAHEDLEARVRDRTAELGTANQALLGEVARRMRLEDELRQRAAELVEADRRKDEFLSTLAHELRNPLSPILNAIQALNILGAQTPDVQRLRHIIERQTKHLSRLVDDLLDVSRITRGNITLRTESADLRDIVRRALEDAGPLIASLSHDVRVSLPDQPVRVDVDPTRLEQVLVNLLNNAAKYTEPGGRIWLSMEVARGEAIVRIRDNGIGMQSDLLPHVFNLFVQAERSLDRSQGGLGVGLTLVKTLVEMHGGQVSAHSRGLGHGSEFVVRLPMSVGAEERSRTNPLAPSESRATRRVLVVDDNVDAAETLADLLGLWGHEVCLAHHGTEAIELACRTGADVVLLDIGLPGMDGYEVARRLRQELALKDTLVVALTGYGQDEDRRRSEEAGFHLHLTKPVSPEQLQWLLSDGALSARQRRSPDLPLIPGP